MGPARLTRHEIRLWQEDEGVEIARWERRAIMAIDTSWLRAQAQSMAATAASNRTPT